MGSRLARVISVSVAVAAQTAEGEAGTLTDPVECTPVT